MNFLRTMFGFPLRLLGVGSQSKGLPPPPSSGIDFTIIGDSMYVGAISWG